jgi:hypothetical protein
MILSVFQALGVFAFDEVCMLADDCPIPPAADSD